MIRYRNKTWFSCLSVLLLAVFVQAQVSGCCELGSWFRSAGPVAEVAKSSVGGAGDVSVAPVASPAEHACCPRKSVAAHQSGKTASSAPSAPSASDASGPTAASHACSSSDHGCCLQGSGLNASGLVSIPSGPSFHAALPLPVHVLGMLPDIEAVLRFDLARMDSGPPASRASLPLLI